MMKTPPPWPELFEPGSKRGVGILKCGLNFATQHIKTGVRDGASSLGTGRAGDLLSEARMSEVVV